ncbi:MAG: TonB family protein [Beijerinckiaceae bacterium]|nr:TonB family protein [Beijerinckiaceae bacterium]
MSVASLSGGRWLLFTRTPLAFAAWLSAFLHTALVMAFVLVPDAIRVPEPPRLTEVSLGPEIAPVSNAPLPAIVPLPEAKPPEVTARDEENQPAAREDAGPERQASLPGVADAPLPPTETVEPSPLPDIQPAPPASSAAPAGPDAVPAGGVSEVKPVTPNATSPASVDAAAAVGSVAPPDLASATSSSASVADARPDDLATAAPALSAPLFPPEAQGAAPPTGETLALPVISSDDGPSPPAEVTPQSLNPADLPSVTDAGPDGEAQRSDAGSLRNAGRARPVAPPKRPAATAQGEQSSPTPTRGRSEVYDPGVRARYSGSLFAHLRRRLVFPTDGPSGTATIRFILDRSGRILQSGVVGSSGSPELDAQALEIVQRAAPFPRFPDGFGSSQLEVTLPVTFKGQ